MKRNDLIKFAATFLGIGYLPMPGTAASLAGLGLYLILVKTPFFNGEPAYFHLAYSIILSVIICIGFCVCGKAQSIFGVKDDGRIVIDELIGMLIAFWGLYLTGICTFKIFFLFRLFDIWKPFPIKKLEKLSGGLGIIADDIAAGIYANISARLILVLMARFMN